MNAQVARARILVVDDAPEGIWPVVLDLEEDYQVHVAAGGRRSLELAKRLDPSLILLDIMMPEMDGYEVLRHLVNDADASHLPVVFLTSRSDGEYRAQGMAMGAMDYLVKPSSGAVVKRVADSILKLQAVSAQRNQLLKRLLSLRAELKKAPASELEFLQESKTSLPTGPRVKPKVLVVDEHESSAREVAKSLRGKYQVTVASDAISAHGMLVSESPALILLSATLNGFAEWSLRWRLDPAGRNVPLMLIGERGDGGVRVAFDTGAIDCVCRPIDPILLSNAVGAALAQEARVQRRERQAKRLEGVNAKLSGMLWRETLQLLRQHRLLRAQERGTGMLLEDHDEACFVVTPTGRFLKANQALVELLGYSSFEELARSASEGGWRTYLSDLEHARVAEALRRDGTLEALEISLQKADGSLVACLLEGGFIRGSGGSCIYGSCRVKPAH